MVCVFMSVCTLCLLELARLCDDKTGACAVRLGLSVSEGGDRQGEPVSLEIFEIQRGRPCWISLSFHQSVFSCLFVGFDGSTLNFPVFFLLSEE